MKYFKSLAITMASGALLLANTVSAAEITGAGASFPNPIYSKWADAYQKATGNRGDTTMDLNAKTAKLHWLVTLVALALATVAAQSPFF